jgi:hypothetical protein
MALSPDQKSLCVAVLWHAELPPNISDGPETYMLDGKQDLVAGAGDSLYTFEVEE